MLFAGSESPNGLKQAHVQASPYVNLEDPHWTDLCFPICAMIIVTSTLQYNYIESDYLLWVRCWDRVYHKRSAQNLRI